MPDQASLADDLRSAGITQEAAARALGVDQSTMSRYLSGKRQLRDHQEHLLRRLIDEAGSRRNDAVDTVAAFREQFRRDIQMLVRQTSNEFSLNDLVQLLSYAGWLRARAAFSPSVATDAERDLWDQLRPSEAQFLEAEHSLDNMHDIAEAAWEHARSQFDRATETVDLAEARARRDAEAQDFLTRAADAPGAVDPGDVAGGTTTKPAGMSPDEQGDFPGA